MFNVMALDFEDIGQFVKDFENRTHFLSDIDLMQFTGLLDKNGKEIYEGDILEYKDAPVLRTKIQYNPKYLSYEFINRFGIIKILDTKEDSFEVIGNIYENPNLLVPPTIKK